MRILTINKLDAFEVISALQKSIRRGDERQAMYFALELAHTNKACFTMLLNRLRVIAHEDIGLANPRVVAFVMATCDTLAGFYEKNGWRIMIGNCVLALARSRKCREGDHFATCCRIDLERGYIPKIPDVAYDKHTGRGKRLGRGVDHFITEGARLDKPPATPDPYQAEAFQKWREQEHGIQGHAGPPCPDDADDDVDDLDEARDDCDGEPEDDRPRTRLF